MVTIKKFLSIFNTFRSKLTLAFIITSMIPLLLSICMALGIINNYLKKNSMQTLSYSANLETQQIESKLEQIIHMQDSLSSFFTTALNASPEEKEISSSSLAQFETIRANVTSLEYVYGVERIRIYSDMLPFTSGDSFHFFPLADLSTAIMKEISSVPSSIVPLNFIQLPDTTDASDLISFYKIVKNIKGEIIAVYFIDMNLENTVNQLLSPANASSAVTILHNGKALYTHIGNPSLSDELFPDTLDGNISHDKNYQVKRNSSLTDWNYVFTSSKKVAQKVNFALLSGYLFVFSFTVLLCMTAIFFFPNKLSKRIQHLSHTINEIGEKDLASSSVTEKIRELMPRNPSYKDEIDDIISSFYNLFQKNMQLNHTVQKHLIEIEKSKFTILREQINPHFLYNSLDTIRICMLMEKKDTACSLIRSLSQFYRISLSKGKDIITLEEELKMISAYLDIEYIGYDGHLQWNFFCPSELKACGIPKFTLQPIVENSIVHGDFSNSDFTLSIEIRIFYEAHSIYILISDNGPGISEKKLQELNILLSSEHFSHTESYGLQNCCQRIRLYYGKPYGISLQKVKKGTCTCIRLPDRAFCSNEGL